MHLLACVEHSNPPEMKKHTRQPRASDGASEKKSHSERQTLIQSKLNVKRFWV